MTRLPSKPARCKPSGKEAEIAGNINGPFQVASVDFNLRTSVDFVAGSLPQRTKNGKKQRDEIKLQLHSSHVDLSGLR